MRNNLVNGKRKLRIGIYAGTFDPVHAGHIAFALQAMKSARLDQVVFMPERRPRYKPGVEHYAHRVAMLKAALRPYRDLAVIEVVDRNFTVRRVLPMLAAIFPDAELVFLFGSDAALAMPDWQHAERLLNSCGLVVGVRSRDDFALVEQTIASWGVAPQSLTIFDSYAAFVTSSRIRHALRTNQYTEGLLASVHRYARQEWLYVSAA